MELSRDYLTEKGNLKSGVQKAIREQAIKSLIECGYELKPNGKLSKVIGTIGENVISTNIEVSIGLNTNFERKATANRTPKETETVVVPNLF
jgi:hypothetical protein